MELSSRSVKLVLLVDPLVLTELGVECALLQPAHLESEARSDLLQTRLLLVLKHVTVMAHKDEIALVVEGHDLATLKLRLVFEERSKEAPHAVAKTRGEVVENELRLVVRALGVILDVLIQLYVRDLEKRCRTFWQTTHKHTVHHKWIDTTLADAIPLSPPHAHTYPLQILLFSERTIRCVNSLLVANCTMSLMSNVPRL